MNAMTKIAVFIVGLGAPASLYADYLDDLKKHLPHTKLYVLEWWNQDDFGMNALKLYIGNSDVILIGHSAGGVIALQALAKWPDLVKKIIMLDSHFLRKQNALPKVNRMLDIMLTNDNLIIQNRVKSAYSLLIDNDIDFTKALNFAIEWVNNSFDQVCGILNTMPAHSVLYVGCTNSSYQILDVKDKKIVLAVWEKFNVDVKFVSINHFDLIDDKYAKRINQLIAGWLHL